VLPERLHSTNMPTAIGILSAGKESLCRNQIASRLSRGRCCYFSQQENCCVAQLETAAARFKLNNKCARTTFRELKRSRYLGDGLSVSECVGANPALLAQAVSL
jgi:hypothetical protein